MNTFDKYLNETLNMLNERSINKINKEFSEVVVKMAGLAKEYSTAEGEAKAKILAELKELTAKKKALTNELDDAVAGKDRNIELAIKEAYGKSAGLSKEETMEVAQKFADAMSKVDGTKVTVNKRTLEEDSFDLDVDGEEFDGGSYNIYQNGNVMNMAVRNNPVYGKKNDTVDTIAKNMKKASANESVNESVDTEYAVMLTGGSIGDKPRPRDAKGYAGLSIGAEEVYTLEKAKEKAKRMNKALSPGERSYYKLKYVVVPVANGKFIKESIMNEGNVKEEMSLRDAIEKEKRSNDRRFETEFPTRELRSIENTKNHKDLSDSAKKVLAKLKKKYSISEESQNLYNKNESVVTEGKKVTLKRRYTENHPAITAGKNAKIRNKVLEFIKDGRITTEAFENFVASLSNNSKRWTKNNSKYFTISEEGVSLSMFGKKILAGITVNEAVSEKLDYKKLAKQFVNDEWLDVDDNIDDADEYFDDKLNAFNREELGNSKEFDNNKTDMSIEVKKLLKGKLKQIFEATTENPEVWVPGAFDKELSKLPNSKINLSVVSKLARKHGVDLDDAIRYVEYGWDMDLNENKTNMKTKFIYESFSEFVNSLNESTETLNEAFASAKLASILTGAYAMPKDLPQAFYNMSKLSLDKIQDVDIIEMTPEQAKKEKRASAVYLYFTTNEKPNPYAGESSWRDQKNIPANTLLAITDGSNEWMNAEWNKYNRSQKDGRTLKTTKRNDSAGLSKSGANDKYGTGISSMKQVAELADRAYCLDLTILKARYSTEAQRAERTAAKKGAIAFTNDKDFKAANKQRYNEILATKAAAMPIDAVVLGAIESLSAQIKDAISSGNKGRYGDILIGLDQRGKEVKLNDASNLMRNILDEYSRYCGSVAQNEAEKAAGYTSNYYDGAMKQQAKNITDYVKKIETKSYGW